MSRKGSLTITPSTRRTVSARERKQKSQSSYLQLMNNIAADLGVMLDDLCPKQNEESQNLSIILSPCSFKESYNENHNNTGMFFSEPARNKSLNELQAERRYRRHKDEEVPSLPIDPTSSSVQVTNPAQPSFLSDSTFYGQAVPGVRSVSDSSFYGQAASEASFTLKERLDRTSDIWYQPEITKNVAIKALQAAPLGSFIFRGSRTKDHLSLSVQQKSDNGYYIENYPVKLFADNRVQLLKSEQVFQSVTHLVLHHMGNKGCLPMLLQLPSQVMAANTLQELQHLNCQATSVWRNSQTCHQSKGPNQNTLPFLHVASEPNKTMTRVKSTPQINFQPHRHEVVDNATDNQSAADLIDLSTQTRTSLMAMRRSSSYNGSTNPFLNNQQAANTVPPMPSFNFQQTHHSTILDFHNTSENYFWNPHSPKKESSQLLDPYNIPSTFPSHLPERDSGLPDQIRETQRLSLSPIQDTMSYFDPLDSGRDSGVYPNSHTRDSVYSESGHYQTKSNDTIVPSINNRTSGESWSKGTAHGQFQTESVIHRKHEQLRVKHSSLDSLDESSQFSGVSSASSGERFSLLSTSSSEESAKNIAEITASTKKGVKPSKYQKTRKHSIQKLTKAFSSFSRKKNKHDSEKRIKGNTDKMNEDVGEEAAECIERAVLRRSREIGTFLCMTIDEFISSKAGKKHEKPEEMMHSIRQLIGGMKRHLIAMQGDHIIKEAIQQNAHKLNQEVEPIIEAALHQRILVPLKETIYSNYYHEYNRNGSILLLGEKMAAARLQTKEQLGIKANFVPPNEEQMRTIKECFDSLQEAYSPYDKMELILKAVTYIYDFVGDKEQGRAVKSMGADDFLPMLIYILVQCDVTTIEIETDYIWSLLEPTAFTGEPAYYLTTLTSAIHVLKNVEYFEEDVVDNDNNTQKNEEEEDINVEDVEVETTEFIIHRSTSVSGTKGFLEVVVTVTAGVLQEKMLPVWPGMTTKQICRNLALKNRIDEKDREHFGLFKLERNQDGKVIKETLLQDNECPQTVKDEMTYKGTLCDFGFKNKFYRVDWPVNNKMVAETQSDESEEEDVQTYL